MGANREVIEAAELCSALPITKAQSRDQKKPTIWWAFSLQTPMRWPGMQAEHPT
jgi:hypothetical protein